MKRLLKFAKPKNLCSFFLSVGIGQSVTNFYRVHLDAAGCYNEPQDRNRLLVKLALLCFYKQLILQQLLENLLDVLHMLLL